MAKSKYEQLLTELPKIAKIVEKFPEGVQKDVFAELISALDVSSEHETPSVSDHPKITSSRLMSMNDLVIKGLPKNESEWMLMYAYYLWHEKKKRFTKEDLVQKYKDTKRYTRPRQANFSNSLKSAIKKGWIRSTNGDHTIDQSGQEKAKEIFARESASRRKLKAKAAKKGGVGKQVKKKKRTKK